MMEEWRKNLIKEVVLDNSNEKFPLGDGWTGEVLRHSSSFHLCGYVYIPKGSIFHGKEYDEIYQIEDCEISVHGDLTHSSEDGELWRLGFDCAHLGDISPYVIFDYNPIFIPGPDDRYRNFEYVKREVKSLAKQLKSWEKKL